MRTMGRNIAVGFLSLVFSLIFFLGSGGAASAATQPANDVRNEPAVGTSQYEGWLANQVRHNLVMLPYYGVFDNLEYSVDGNTVTLAGQVTRPTLKEDAGRVVKGIEGVQTVNNQIEVLPLSPNDDRIRRDTYRAIYTMPQLQRYALGAVQQIHIIVKNGNITLEGVVANEGDRNVANIRANSVPGAFSVTNNLRTAG